MYIESRQNDECCDRRLNVTEHNYMQHIFMHNTTVLENYNLYCLSSLSGTHYLGNILHVQYRFCGKTHRLVKTYTYMYGVFYIMGTYQNTAHTLNMTP